MGHGDRTGMGPHAGHRAATGGARMILSPSPAGSRRGIAGLGTESPAGPGWARRRHRGPPGTSIKSSTVRRSPRSRPAAAGTRRSRR
eukprot:342356-Hanusia_phi.AAC.1